MLLPFLEYGADYAFNYFLSKPMSRLCETEADTLGVRICTEAGFDATKGTDFFKRTKDGTFEFLSTHPSNKSRVDHIIELSK